MPALPNSAACSPILVDRLRDEFGIYMVRSGRANVAGFSQENLPYLAKAIAAVND